MKANGLDISFPHQCFINGEFLDAESGAVYETVDPANENVSFKVGTIWFLHNFLIQVICKVSKGGKADVYKAVAAAKANMMLEYCYWLIFQHIFNRLGCIQ